VRLVGFFNHDRFAILAVERVTDMDSSSAFTAGVQSIRAVTPLAKFHDVTGSFSPLVYLFFPVKAIAFFGREISIAPTAVPVPCAGREHVLFRPPAAPAGAGTAVLCLVAVPL
jgi:hypothetical protein